MPSLPVLSLAMLVLVAGCAGYTTEDGNGDASVVRPPKPAPAPVLSPETQTQTPASSKPATEHRRLADETHDFVVGSLLTTNGSYRTKPAEDRTDEWHDISQIGADVAMLALGDM